MRRQLRWLPITQRIVFKLTTVTYKARLSGLPAYLQREIHDYLRPELHVQQQQPATVSFAARAFCAAAPIAWNSLGVHTCLADTFLTFLPRDAMQARSMLSCSVVRLSVCPSVCHVRGSRQNE